MSFERTFFITGFPGFIAERLIRKIASPSNRLFLLVQPALMPKAADDVKRIAELTETPADNFVIVEGDITLPGLGIPDDTLESVLAETTDVYHFAAIYDLEVDKEPAYAVNVEGTKNVNDLVRRVENLRRYNYVSTCYVAGRREGVITEDELEHDAGFRNFYEETKYLAEVEVEKLKTEVPVTIFRPSVVCGDSETGETAKFDGIYYVIKFLLRSPELFRLVNVGNEKVKLNLVPVDFVIDAMTALADDENAVGKTVAVADPDPYTTREICDLIAEAVTSKRSVVTPPARMVETFLNTPVSPPLTGLPHSGVPYFFQPQRYDTSVADSLLEPHGIRCPRFPDYIEVLVNYVIKNSPE